MTKTRFSHAACAHPSTKAGRAACRKALRAAAEPVQAAKAATPTVGTTAAKKDPRKAAAPVSEKTESAPVVDVTTDDAATSEPVEITPDTWRDHKDTAALVYVKGVEQPFAAQAVTGYSIKFLQFTDSEGKRQRIPVSTVERVTV